MVLLRRSSLESRRPSVGRTSSPAAGLGINTYQLELYLRKIAENRAKRKRTSSLSNGWSPLSQVRKI